MDKGGEIIGEGKEERKNRKMDKRKMMVVEEKMVYWEFVWKVVGGEGLGRVEG